MTSPAFSPAMEIHFISDLHLEPSRPGLTDILLRYLNGTARQAGALYVLGDFFEFWIGDDISIDDNAAVIDALAALADNGTRVYFMHGNRDFLIGADFARRARARLLDDPTVIDLGGARTLLMHGDTLCTDDEAYQRFRAQVRDPDNQRQFLALPAAQRRQIAQTLRGSSRSEQAGKSMDIMDVNGQAVREAMQRHGATRLIHGHTHRPARHRVDLDNRSAERIVLSDWHDERGSVLICNDSGCRFRDLT